MELSEQHLGQALVELWELQLSGHEHVHPSVEHGRELLHCWFCKISLPLMTPLALLLSSAFGLQALFDPLHPGLAQQPRQVPPAQGCTLIEMPFEPRLMLNRLGSNAMEIALRTNRNKPEMASVVHDLLKIKPGL